MCHTGCVSEAQTAEENPAMYSHMSPSHLLCPMKNGKHCESIPLNLPPTRILSAWFSDAILVGNRGAEARATQPWYSRDPRAQDCLVRRIFWPLLVYFTHKHLYHHKHCWLSTLWEIHIHKGLFYKTNHGCKHKKSDTYIKFACLGLQTQTDSLSLEQKLSKVIWYLYRAELRWIN